MNGSVNIWSISPEERLKHDTQFDSLTPVLGHLSGEQAKKFFLQSGLPPQVLAEIWSLADMNDDGKMDRLEFSIAMKLIKITLQGRGLPPSLPTSMKQPPTVTPPSMMTSSTRFGMGSMPNLSVGMSTMLTPVPLNPSLPPLVPMPMTLPLMSGLANGNANLLTPSPMVTNSVPLSGFSSPMAFSPSTGMSKANSLLDLASSSNSSSTTSLASNSNSPKTGSCDWSVPQASRLKYRQQFNGLDKLMTGYLSGPQVKNVLTASNLTQTQLATIWTLADVDKDGQLRAEEFILAMHLVDMAKTGCPLPLTLPSDLVPPSFRESRPGEMLNGTGPSPSDRPEVDPSNKNVSYEDRLKANFARGSAELEKRRMALEEEQRREKERREREARQLKERREKEAQEQENRKRAEEERRREMERRVEEDRQREKERKEVAQQELERQQKEEWERGRKDDLCRRRAGEQQEIAVLRAKKKQLQMELEAVGSRHKQLSDCLRDAQTKRRIQRAELDLVNQRRDGRASEINSLQIQFEDFQNKLSQLVPQQQRLTERLHTMKYNHIPAVALTSLSGVVVEKGVACRRLKDQLDALERETTDKLAMMDHYQQDIKYVDMDDCVLQALLSLLGCLSQLFLLIKDLREQQGKQQAVLEDLCRVKELKLRELERRREEERERKRREEEEEAARQAKLEEERKEEEKREEERRQQLQRQEQEEETNLRRLQEEQRAKQREEEEREAQDHFRAAQEQAQEEESRRCREEEEDKKRTADQMERGGALHPSLNVERSLTLISYRALYPFTARSANELSLDADCLIEVDDETVGEPGWLCGSYRGNRGWFPQSYAERCPVPALPEAPAAPGHTLLPPFGLTAPPSLGLPDGEMVRAGRSPDPITDSTQENIVPSEPIYCTVAELESPDPLQIEEYVALYTYESPEVGDLTFSEGDVVMVTEREGEWWRGCIGDQTGVFPSNYVKQIIRHGAASKKPEIAQSVSAVVALTTEQLSLSPGQLIVVLAKNTTGWWLGELQARGKKRQRGWFHSSHVKLLGPTSSKMSPATVPVCKVIAKYDYTAANQDEMSFFKGQLINILDKDNPDWWKGEVNGVTGLLPTNYVTVTTDSDPSQQWCADLVTLDSMTPSERKRQGYIHELIHTEQTYLDDLELVMEVFYKPMSVSGHLTEDDMAVIFVNWSELITCNSRLLRSLHALKAEGGANMPVQLIGERLWSELSDMQVYVTFCSCQLNAAALLQHKTNAHPHFRQYLRTLATNYRCKGMPLSSFFLKPMQRITRYPLLIKNILEHTLACHPDVEPLRAALERAEEVCCQVNEGVREKENSEQLDWIQTHVQCEGAIEHLVFNSQTNCLGPRKLLHSGRLHKTKSTRELWVFLFNDFLLFTQPANPFSSSPLSTYFTGADKLFSTKSNTQLKMYKTPLFLNEVLVKMPSHLSSDEPLFHISHIDRMYTLKTDTMNERTTWVQRIKAASEHFIETQKRNRERAYQARSLLFSGVGRLTVVLMEAQELKACRPDGRSNPYCQLTVGAQCYTSRPVSDTPDPKWNFTCHFFIQDLYQDVLSISVSDKNLFSPDEFLGRTAVPVATIKKDMENMGAATRRLLLHEAPTGEVWVKLDLQLYDQPE
ncbi:intersectin-2a isoform X2 [Esox lucius]|uniref:intersectin-2a isoform X2 n=1 Tax=Esox lucius TaxID=8010 RepID=UPI0014776498|nr:intersectin-2a isoform X2 [Esox lucius]